MANVYQLTYTLTLDVTSTSKGEAKQIADHWLDDLGTSEDTVETLSWEFEDIELIEEEEE